MTLEFLEKALGLAAAVVSLVGAWLTLRAAKNSLSRSAPVDHTGSSPVSKELQLYCWAVGILVGSTALFAIAYLVAMYDPQQQFTPIVGAELQLKDQVVRLKVPSDGEVNFLILKDGIVIAYNGAWDPVCRYGEFGAFHANKVEVWACPHSGPAKIRVKSIKPG